MLDLQLVSNFRNFAVQNANKVFVHIMDLLLPLENMTYLFFITVAHRTVRQLLGSSSYWFV